MPKNAIRPVSRTKEVVVQDYGTEILIYDLIANKALSLNETSAKVWQHCDGKNTISDIARDLSKELKTSIDEDFVWLALENLKKENLLENPEEVLTDINNFSRREVIRKVGFASLATLPVILSLVAPTAAQTASSCAGASGRPLGCACTANTQCVGNSSTQCCSRIPENRTRACVTANTLRTSGQSCGNNCDCVSNTCTGAAGNGTCA